MYGTDLLPALITTTELVPCGPSLSFPFARSSVTDSSTANCFGSNNKPLIKISESAWKFSPKTQSFFTPLIFTLVIAGKSPPSLGRMVKVNDLESTRDGLLESMTWATKEREPAELGTPPIKPFVERVSPDGSAPPAICQR